MIARGWRELILNEEGVVTLMGKAGTGRTLLALAASLCKVVQDQEYRRLVVARPTIPMGREPGYLPGSLEKKLELWMRPIQDALEMLSDLNMGREECRRAELVRTRIFAIEALSCVRGAQHRQPIHRDRREAIPHPPGGQDDHHPGGA
jgi:PhoH-like ATPase